MPELVLVGGFDCLGNAGVLADRWVADKLGVSSAVVVSAIVPQGVEYVSNCFSVDPEVVASQLDSVFRAGDVGFLKIGVVASEEVVSVLEDFIVEYNMQGRFVLDLPVVSSSGFRLIGDGVLGRAVERLAPLSAVVTPNLSEFGVFREMCGDKLGFVSLLKSKFVRNGLVCDCLIDEEGKTLEMFKSEVLDVDMSKVRGTGCRLATAIAVYLSRNMELRDAVESARIFLREYIEDCARA